MFSLQKIFPRSKIGEIERLFEFDHQIYIKGRVFLSEVPGNILQF